MHREREIDRYTRVYSIITIIIISSSSSMIIINNIIIMIIIIIIGSPWGPPLEAALGNLRATNGRKLNLLTR